MEQLLKMISFVPWFVSPETLLVKESIRIVSVVDLMYSANPLMNNRLVSISVLSWFLVLMSRNWNLNLYFASCLGNFILNLATILVDNPELSVAVNR